MLSLSEKEPHYVGDIIEQCGYARSFVSKYDTVEEFEQDRMAVMATEKALQNISECCIRLRGKVVSKTADGKPIYSGRLNELFPEFPPQDMAALGNLLRHDYGRIDASQVWEAVFEIVPKMQDRAEKLRDDHIRFCGMERSVKRNLSRSDDTDIDR